MVGEQLHDKKTEGYLKTLLSFSLDTSVNKNLVLFFILYNFFILYIE